MNECVVLLDFTTIQESSQFKLKDLDFVIYTKDVDYQLHHELFDSKKVKDLLPKKMGRSLQTRGLSKIFVK
jgi:hypothetical protein